MSQEKQIPKILDWYRKGWQDRRDGKPASPPKNNKKVVKAAYLNGYYGR